MIVKHIEHGIDYITLYFATHREMTDYSTILYGWFNGIANFTHMNLQREWFRHLPGDVPHFHPNGDPIEVEIKEHFHFHIIYPHTPKQEDWDFLYLWGNRNTLTLNKNTTRVEV